MKRLSVALGEENYTLLHATQAYLDKYSTKPILGRLYSFKLKDVEKQNYC